MKFGTNFAVILGATIFSASATAQTYTAVELSGQGSWAFASYNNVSGGTVVPAGSTGSLGHATLWDSAGVATDVHPGFLDTATTVGASEINGMWNFTMAGTGRGSVTNNRLVAMVWQFGVPSFIPVPDGVNNYLSQAYATDGQSVVGEYIPWANKREQIAPGDSHAYIYDIASNTVTDLYNGNPCVALGVKFGQQVGYELRGDAEARLWSGNAKTFVNLHNSAFAGSMASALDGGRQVGYSYNIQNRIGENKRGRKVRYDFACMWSGSASSLLFLSNQYPNSHATDISGLRICGEGIVTNIFGTRGATHALVWNSPMDAAIELHDLLPSGYVSSFANSIDSFGNVSGSAVDSTGKSHAILWVRQP